MKRKIIGKLLKLKDKSNNLKPILICGVKHVGKTYVLKEFANLCYNNTFYLNFNTRRDVSFIFKEKKEAKNLVSELESFMKQKIEKGRTLIIFDDLHFCPKALYALILLADAGYDIAATIEGNPLNFDEIKRDLKVGAILAETLYPMDFEEFLWAKGREVLAFTINNHFNDMRPMPLKLHESCKVEYESYLITGGMPTVVCAHLYHKNPKKEEEYKELIWDSYISDITGMLSGVSAMFANEAYNSVPFQLEKENNKFQYKFIKPGGRAIYYNEVIDFMGDLGLIYKCKKNDSESFFKIYLNDTGLLASKFKMESDYLRVNSKSRAARAIYENGLALQLIRNGYKLLYWKSGGIAEVDFILVTKDGNIPIEINQVYNSKSKSLRVYSKYFNPTYTIKLSNENFSIIDNCRNVPFYAGFKL